MFGLGIETITLLISTALSFYMKFQAQKTANTHSLLKIAIENRTNESSLMDAAASRGTPWVRKYISVLVISVMFLGLILAPLCDINTDLVMKVPRKEFLYGLFRWGREYEIISSDGFMIPPYAKQIAMVISGFFFGSGFAKVSR